MSCHFLDLHRVLITLAIQGGGSSRDRALAALKFQAELQISRHQLYSDVSRGDRQVQGGSPRRLCGGTIAFIDLDMFAERIACVKGVVA